MSDVVTSGGPVQEKIYQIGDGRVEVCPAAGTATVDGEPRPDISGKKMEILSLLAGRPGFVVPPAEICEALWGEDSDPAKACLGVHLMNLRRSLGAELGDVDEGVVETVRGRGYRARISFEDGDGMTVGENAYLVADERLAVDPETESVFVDGSVVDGVTLAEYRIAHELARRPDRVVGMQTLRAVVHHDERTSTTSAVQNHIKNLRIKLGGRHDLGLGDFRYGAIRPRPGVGYYAVRKLATP